MTTNHASSCPRSWMTKWSRPLLGSSHHHCPASSKGVLAHPKDATSTPSAVWLPSFLTRYRAGRASAFVCRTIRSCVSDRISKRVTAPPTRAIPNAATADSTQSTPASSQIGGSR